MRHWHRVARLGPVTALGASLWLAGCGGAGNGEEAGLPAELLRYEITVGTEGFQPDRVRARKGEAVTLVFTRITEETCGNEVVIPSHDVRKPLPLGEVEVTLVPDASGEIVFGCGMDMMLAGKIVVE